MTDATEYLTRALDKYERNRKSDRVFVRVDVEKTHAEVAKLERELNDLEVAGIIECRRKKAPGGMVEKIKLLSPEAAYQHLERVPSWKRSAEDLAALKENAEEALRQMLDEIEMSWSRNVAWIGREIRLPPDSAVDLENAVRIARKLLDIDRVIDYRTLSLAAGCSSKTLERSEDLVAAVASALSGREREGRSAREFLAELGAEKMPQAIFIAAPKNLPASYLGLPPDEVRAFKFREADYILTIENWVSFVRYAREVKDNGIILYTGGFPSRSWRQAYVEVITQQPGAAAFHWGDVDEAGVRIAASVLALAQERGLRASTHLMTQSISEDCCEERVQLKWKSTGTPELVTPDLKSLWVWLMSAERQSIEQESLDPVSPISQ